MPEGRKDRRGADRRPHKTPARKPAERAGVVQKRKQVLQFRRKNWILFGAGLASIAAGFAVLATGDITIAPILLLLGYLVLIPWSLVSRPKGPDGNGEGTARP